MLNNFFGKESALGSSLVRVVQVDTTALEEHTQTQRARSLCVGGPQWWCSTITVINVTSRLWFTKKTNGGGPRDPVWNGCCVCMNTRVAAILLVPFWLNSFKRNQFISGWGPRDPVRAESAVINVPNSVNMASCPRCIWTRTNIHLLNTYTGTKKRKGGQTRSAEYIFHNHNGQWSSKGK